MSPLLALLNTFSLYKVVHLGSVLTLQAQIFEGCPLCETLAFKDRAQLLLRTIHLLEEIDNLVHVATVLSRYLREVRL